MAVAAGAPLPERQLARLSRIHVRGADRRHHGGALSAVASGGLVLAQCGLTALAAPLLTGGIKAVEASLQGRRGPRFSQPALDVWKYLARESIVSEHGSWIVR